MQSQSFRNSKTYGVLAACFFLVHCTGILKPKSGGSFSREKTTAGGAVEETNGAAILQSDVNKTKAIVSNASIPQTLYPAVGSEIEGSQVIFPAGSLAVGTEITIEPGAEVANDASAGDLELENGNAFSKASPPMAITANNEALAVPFSISLPVADQALALEANYDNLIIVYKGRKTGTTDIKVGIILRSDLTVENGKVSFQTQMFGVFQAAYSSFFINIAREAIPAFLGIKKIDLPAPVVASWTLAVVPGTDRNQTVSFTVSGIDEIARCIVYVDSDRSAPWDDFKSIGTALAFEVVPAFDSAYLMGVRFSCIDKSGHDTGPSPWQDVTFAAKEPDSSDATALPTPTPDPVVSIMSAPSVTTSTLDAQPPQPTFEITSTDLVRGTGAFRALFDRSFDDASFTEDQAILLNTTSFQAPTALTSGPHGVFVQEKDSRGVWSQEATFSFTVDGDGPHVMSMSSSSTGWFTIGAQIPIDVTFSEPLYIAGALTPSFTLAVNVVNNSSPRSAICSSIVGASTLRCVFTVTAGDHIAGAANLVHASTAALSATTGISLIDSTGNAANLTLPFPGTSPLNGSALVVDTIAPMALDNAHAVLEQPLFPGAANLTIQFPENDFEIVKINYATSAGSVTDCVGPNVKSFNIATGASSLSTVIKDLDPGATYYLRICVRDLAHNVNNSAFTGSFVASAHSLFVSSTALSGDLKEDVGIHSFASGLEGADFRCQEEGDDIQPGGHWRAFLSSSSFPVHARIRGTAPVYGVVVHSGNNVEQLGQIAQHIIPIGSPAYDLASAVFPNAASWPNAEEVWTGTSGSAAQTSTAVVQGVATCNDWSDGSPSFSGGAGDPSSTTAQEWKTKSISACNVLKKLYCVSQTVAAPTFSAAFASPNINLSLSLPSDAADTYDHIKIVRQSGVADITDEDCAISGGVSLVTGGPSTLTDSLSTAFADAGATTAGWYTYRLCVFDKHDSHAAYTQQVRVLYPESAVQYAFISSLSYTGNFAFYGNDALASGINGADKVCGFLARSRTLGGVWKAMISTDTPVNLSDRGIVGGANTVKTLDGTSIYTGDNISYFWNGNGGSVLKIDEQGAIVSPNIKAWTGTKNDGTKHSNTCDGWTSGEVSANGRFGIVDTSTPSQRFDSGSEDCSHFNRVYCIRQ